MPATRLDRLAEPKRDPIKALIKERMDIKDVRPEEAAKIMGVSRCTWFNRAKQHTDNWSLAELRRLNTALKTEIEPDEVNVYLRCLGITVRKDK